jgi:hypothetical protein
MDFSTAHSPPFVVNIDGTRYEVPRLTLRDFKSWAARRAKETLDKSLEQFPEPEQRARFMLYWSEPAFDVAALAEDLRTPAGVMFVLETCLPNGGVPPNTITALIDNANAVALRTLAGQLAGVDRAIVELQERSGDGGKKDSPLAGPPPTSEESRPIGDSQPPASPASSDSALKIA